MPTFQTRVTSNNRVNSALTFLSTMKMLQGTLFVALLGFLASAATGSNDFLPFDCNDIYCHDNTSLSGVYTIFPGDPDTPLQVYCDMNIDGGRWTVFLKRMDGTENFFRDWGRYKVGFGNLAGEYWLGLENILLLTVRKENELRVDMEDWEGGKRYAKYSSFSIDSEVDGYRLHLGKFTGGKAGDSLKSHNNMKFSTFDRDQDTWSNNCAKSYLGGFWYFNCHHANPTGLYAPPGLVNQYEGIFWRSWKGLNYGMKTLAMKIRSVSACACAQKPV
ncbi:microfibril-associated glycoprotein 4-like [Trematomus bernacchii]|uniref:microfibril-associated glycoprotein 4-like n=1 Tax=Trematomus bernacchii TaxID=40690 RepID=UPI00146D9ECC|nr:microfibril-associated glycoprotein 4-like [Trematomus bernacchii]